jgi:hypothetical protein
MWRDAEPVQPVGPERLVEHDGHGNRRDARAQSCPGGTCSRVVNHGRRAGEQPVVRHVADEQDVIPGRRQSRPARLHNRAHARTMHRRRDDLVQPVSMGWRHASEAHEDRWRAALQELDQFHRRLPSHWPGRPPVPAHAHVRWPVGRARQHCRTETVADRPALRRTSVHWRRRRGGGGQAEPGTQPRHNLGVQRTAAAEQFAACREVAGRPQVTRLEPARQRELPGGDRRYKIGTDARNAEALSDHAAQRGRAEGRENQVGARRHGRDQAVTQLVEELGKHQPAVLRRGCRHPCPGKRDRIARQRPVLQATPAYEASERAVPGQRDPMPRLLQLLPQTGERRDIAARTRRHDENPHTSLVGSCHLTSSRGRTGPTRRQRVRPACVVCASRDSPVSCAGIRTLP